MGNNIILETKFVADISGSFYIPSYQRGYRWSETEVVRLLDDIYQNGKKNYCLQPVVVRKKEDQYELIDGQQRLTTLYLIYKYMQGLTNNKPDFRIQVKGLFGTEEKRFEVVGGDKKRSATKKKSDLGWIDRLEEIDAALDDF